MYHFFVNNNQIENNQVKIVGGDVNHIKNVLRLNKGEKIEVNNSDSSQKYLCEIQELTKDFILCTISTQLANSNESNVYVHILQGLPKFEKMEWIIEKCTEIGVSEFTPVIMKRCIVKLDEKIQQKKILRWRKIAEVAAKQSKREIIPKINSCKNIKNIYEFLEDYDIVLVAYENEKYHTLKEELIKLKKVQKEKYKIAVLIGTEGGIAEEEIKLLHSLPVKIITLGNRILRTETAPIVISSNIMYELERKNNHGTEENK